MKYHVLTYSYYGSHDKSENILISSDKEFNLFWEKAHEYVYPKPKVPNIDFSKENVLLINLEPRNYGGFKIDLNEIKLMGDTCYVQFTEKKSNLDAPELLVMTNPFIFIKIDKIQLKKIIIKFK